MANEDKKQTIKVEDAVVKEVKKDGDVIVFKINKPVSLKRFELIDEMVRKQMEKSGLKIVLMPFSCDVAEK